MDLTRNAARCQVATCGHPAACHPSERSRCGEPSHNHPDRTCSRCRCTMTWEAIQRRHDSGPTQTLLFPED